MCMYIYVCIYVCMYVCMCVSAYLNTPYHEQLAYKMTWLSRAFWFLTETVWQCDWKLNVHLTKFIHFHSFSKIYPWLQACPGFSSLATAAPSFNFFGPHPRKNIEKHLGIPFEPLWNICQDQLDGMERDSVWTSHLPIYTYYNLSSLQKDMVLEQPGLVAGALPWLA